MEKKYRLSYLPLFYDDLVGIVDYIALELNNPSAAHELADSVEAAILGRLNCPEAFQPYQGRRKRKEKYYRIYVENYVIYYVVVGDVMEVRRILYGKRDSEKYL